MEDLIGRLGGKMLCGTGKRHRKMKVDYKSLPRLYYPGVWICVWEATISYLVGQVDWGIR
jgi:hypothetical protein